MRIDNYIEISFVHSVVQDLQPYTYCFVKDILHLRTGSITSETRLRIRPDLNYYRNLSV